MMLHTPALYKVHMTKDDITELYVSASLRSFAVGLIGIFIPIFLYKQGWSLTNILFFYTIFFSYSLLFGRYLGEYAVKNGSKHLMALSFAFSFASLAFLSIDQSLLVVFCIVAPLYALAESAYWLSHHIILTEAKESGHIGGAVAKYIILVGLTSALGPLIGGIVGEHYGLRAAFIICLVVLILAIKPLFMSREGIDQGEFNFARLTKDKMIIRDLALMGGASVANAVVIVFWPLFIYQRTGGQLIKTGLIVAISLGLTTLACWLAGKLNDNNKGRRVRRSGAVLWALGSLLMVVSPVTIMMAMANNLAYIGQMLSIVPRSATLISHAFSEYRAEYMTAMFMSIQFFKVVFLSIMVIISQQVNEENLLNIGTLLGGAAALLFLCNLSPRMKVKDDQIASIK